MGLIMALYPTYRILPQIEMCALAGRIAHVHCGIVPEDVGVRECQGI